MSKVLYITANVKEVKDSYSLRTGEAFLSAYRKQNPQDEILYKDLFRSELPELDGSLIGYMFGAVSYEQLDPETQHKIDIWNAILKEFMDADKYIFVVPLWNLGNPPVIKSYFDLLTVSNQTFRYTETGPVGLLKDKKAICIQASGGNYSSGPAAAMEHGVSYIKSILGFLGVELEKTIHVEGVNIMTNDAEQILKEAISNAEAAALSF